MDYPTFPIQASLRFRIEADAAIDAIGTLESALAIARRIGAELRNLRAGAGTCGLEVWMRLAARDRDALALCRLRFENIAGIADVMEIDSELPAPARQPDAMPMGA